MFGFCQRQLTAIVIRGYCLVKDYRRPWKTGSWWYSWDGRRLQFHNLVKLNVLTNVLSYYYELELWFSEKNWLQLYYDITVLLISSREREGPEALDRPNMIVSLRFLHSQWCECSHEGTLWFWRVEALVFAKDKWLQMWHDVTVLLKTIPNRGEPEALDSLKLIGSLDCLFIDNQRLWRTGSCW